MSEVRKLIEDAVVPFQEFPRIKHELKAHGNMLRDNQVTQKAIQQDILNVLDQMKEFKTVDKNIKYI